MAASVAPCSTDAAAPPAPRAVGSAAWVRGAAPAATGAAQRRRGEQGSEQDHLGIEPLPSVVTYWARASPTRTRTRMMSAVRGPSRDVRRRVTYACVAVSAVVHSVSSTPRSASGGNGI